MQLKTCGIPLDPPFGERKNYDAKTPTMMSYGTSDQTIHIPLGDTDSQHIAIGLSYDEAWIVGATLLQVAIDGRFGSETETYAAHEAYKVYKRLIAWHTKFWESVQSSAKSEEE